MGKVLSLCFPTYNRGWCMRSQIERLQQCPKEVLDKIEIIVSDNCSTDDTQQIVTDAINKGFSAIYHRNSENLGMDGNFVTCFKMASGEYVWLLGDDDLILIESLVSIINILEGSDRYGLVHIYKKQTFSDASIIKYTDKNDFCRKVSYWSTFISANIVRTEYVNSVDFEKYMGTWFTLMPVYFSAILSEPINCLINFRVFENPKDKARNGGYNYFQVFVANYLTIWGEYKDKGLINKSTYSFIKKESFIKNVAPLIYPLLIEGKKRNYDVENGFKIIKKYYGREVYAYTIMACILLKNKFRQVYYNVKSCFKRNKE